MSFIDRIDAGRRLAAALEQRFDPRLRHDVAVLGLPRGGVPVAEQVAAALRAPLDVIVVRKLGVPGQPELAAGALGEGGTRVLNPGVVEAFHLGGGALEHVADQERAELDRRSALIRRIHPRLSLLGRTAIVVDDGVATGATARAACEVARAHGAARVVLAVPVAPRNWTATFGDVADDYVALQTPDDFVAVGQWYAHFEPVGDDEVLESLQRAALRGWDAHIEVAGWAGRPGASLDGHLDLPAGLGQTPGIVVFAHGSGSSRHSPRNRMVAAALVDAGLGTLLFDLLTEDEAVDRRQVFDVDHLAHRLSEVTRWLRSQYIGTTPRIGYFGASTGAAAALAAAAAPGSDIAAVVSRGGRPDLASRHLGQVRAPTLLLVGGEDHEVLRLNRQAASRLLCEHRLDVIPGATHLFEEPGTLADVAHRAADWFAGHLRAVQYA